MGSPLSHASACAWGGAFDDASFNGAKKPPVIRLKVFHDGEERLMTLVYVYTDFHVGSSKEL